MGLVSNILTTATNKLGRTGLRIQKYSPEILLVSGIAMTITGVVKACMDTHAHCDDILNEYKENISRADDTLKLVEENKKAENPVPMQEYTVVDMKKDKRKFKLATGIKFVKTYALDAALIVGGIVCMTGSYKVVKGRFKGAAALAASTGAELYTIKKRIIDQLGYEEGQRVIYGAQVIDADVTEKTESGEEVIVTKPLNVISDEKAEEMSQYAVWFDEHAGGWAESPTHNLAFLRMTQDHFTDILNARGHVFLNEVFDRLGLPRTNMGAVCGWVKGMGDDMVDFGIYNAHRKDAAEFLAGYSNVVLLDFNCDGVIWDKI